nr:DNA-directed DNA polymerase [Tanacetum cinerariifolium]
MKTPISTETKLTKDEEGESVDNTEYQGMIGSLLYLTESRPDIMSSVCLDARFQEDPKTSHLKAVKRIFRYIKGTTRLGLWYPKGSGIETIVYVDFDHAGDYVDRKRTSGICTFTGCCLTSWFCKKQTALAISTTEAEYDLVRALLLDKKNQSSAPASSSTPAPVRAIEPNCVTCDGAHSYQNYPATSGNVYQDNIQEYVSQAAAANYNQGNTGFRPQIVANQMRPPGSGTLPSNTITNPKEDLKGITTRSGAAYQGPPIPTQSKVVKQGTKVTKVTKDQVQTPSSQSTAPVQPPVAQPETQTLVSEPVVAPNPDKRALFNGHPKQVAKKTRRPQKFLIPCEFLGMDECLALADLGASINLMPLFVWEGLSLSELTLTFMTLELADRSVSKPIGIAKDVSVKVEVFHFPVDFVVVDFEPDPRVPLILGRCFLKTGRALIDVHKGELTLRIGKEAITYNLDQTVRYSANYNQMTENKIDVICEIYSQEVLGFSDVTASSNPTPYDDSIVSTTSPTLTPFGDSDFLLFEEADAFLSLEDDPDSPKINPFYYDPEGDILLLEAILNSEPLPPFQDYKPAVQHQRRVNPKIHNIIKKEVEKLLDAGLIYPISDSPWVSPVCIDYRKLNEATRKDHFPLSFMDQMLERLARNEYYCFLDVFGNSFENCLSRLDKMLQRCENTNLSLNWEKSHFMVKEGIVLSHKISRNRIEVDKAKVDVIAMLPHPTTVKDCIKAFQTLKKKLTEAPILIAPNWDLPFELMCDASDFAIGAVLGQRHEKHFKPIHYASKTMNDAKSNYTTTEKEMLAVV